MGALKNRAPRVVLRDRALLEHQSQTVLYFATVVRNQLRGDLTEIGAGEIHRWICKLDAVKEVVSLEPRLQPEAFSYLERFAECGVRLPDTRSIQTRVCPRIIATMQVR